MRWGLLVVVVLTGCGAADPCGGPRPALLECQNGIAWSDCGGASAEPRFACRGADCRWFVGGCVAAEFDASQCPASELCCRAGGAFDGPPTGSERDFGVSATTLGWGTEPWDAARERSVTVDVGPTDPGARPFVTCSEASDLLARSACQATGSDVHASFASGVGVTIVSATGPAGFGGHSITVEITTDEAGTPHARVCSVPYQDSANGLCQDGQQARGCAVSGRVTIAALVFDATTQIDVSATFADGSTIDMRL